MKRRNFLINSTLTLGTLALSRFTSFADVLANPMAFKIRMLTPKLGVFTEQGGTIIFLISDSGISVVDSQFPAQAKNLIDELKKRYDKPFDLLINTHHHGDHSGGNIAFKGLVNQVVAHSNSAINQKRVFDEAIKAGKTPAEQYFPTITFDKKWKYKSGGETIKAHYFGAGHTNGDAMIHFEDQNVVHMGDLVFNRRYPFIDRAGGANISNWIKILDKGMATFGTKTQYVFGHAFDPEKIVGTKDDVRAFQDYLEKLLTHVGLEIKAGKSKEEIMKATAIPGVTEWKGDGIGRGIDAAYQELTAK